MSSSPCNKSVFGTNTRDIGNTVRSVDRDAGVGGDVGLISCVCLVKSNTTKTSAASFCADARCQFVVVEVVTVALE